jgi:uncharacterized protein (TIGR02145 family)
MTVKAQVTIGETEAPVNGALLQLKNMANINGAEINADKGLALPRVNLISKTALYPMFTTTTDTLNTIHKKNHTGLMVYNTNRCLTKNEGKDGRGIWIWDGTMWNNTSVLDEASSLFVSTDLLDLPSGSDARGAVVPVDIELVWSPVEKQVSYTTPIASPPFSSFAFTSITPASPISGSSGKASVSFLPVAMVIPTNPWQSRQVEMIFTLVDAECGNINKKVILNQTNYVLRSYNNGYNYTGVAKNFLNIASDFIKLTDTNPFYLRIRGNADWKVTVKDDFNVIVHNIPAIGNAELNNFTNTPWPGDFVVAGVKYPGGKYTKASILIEDQYTPHRAKPVTVTCYSCIGTPDLSSVTITANNMQTELGDPGWGTNVVRHLAKPGVYEEFYSADFGDAGRWMTTNLAATAYDDNTHSQGKTLNGPYIMGYYNEPYWCYPKAHGSIITIGESPSQEYIDNPTVGFLYNWDAATAGKGGSTGKYPLVNEKGFTEGDGTGQQERIQGVCPKGWHLPSDYEWTGLENEIITRTTKYSETNEDIGPPLLSFIRPQGSKGSHGAAMKDSCEPIYRVDMQQGYSKGYFQGGFNVAFAGWAVNNQTANFHSAVFFWTSSATGAWGSAWMRQFLSSSNGVDANIGGRHTGAPVRCKKDE